MLSHAREYAADLACQAGTAKVLHAACEKLHHEQRMVKAMHHHQVLALSVFKAPYTCWSLDERGTALNGQASPACVATLPVGALPCLILWKWPLLHRDAMQGAVM